MSKPWDAIGSWAAEAEAEEANDWGAGKKSYPVSAMESGPNNWYGSLEGVSRADGVESWNFGKKPTVAPPPARSNTFSSCYRDSAMDSNGWRRGGEDIDRDNSQSFRQRLVLDPRKGDDSVTESAVASTSKPILFGSARPREDVLTENGLDWKKIDLEIKGSRPTSSQGSRQSSAHSSRSENTGLGQAGPSFGEESEVKPRPKVNSLVDAKPKEVVLQEKGKDWGKIDQDDEQPPAGELPQRSFFRSVSWTDRSPNKPNPTRPQFNNKARSLLPPLQPLSVARRSVEEWPKAGSDDLGVWPNPPSTPGGGSGPANKLTTGNSASTPMEFEFQKDKMAFFDKECSRITDHVYLGSDAVAKNREILEKNGITHVLNCVGFNCPEYFKGEIEYKTLWLHDRPTEDITSILYDVFDYVEDVRAQGGRVLVHCCQGVSRSTALVIAYLMWREGRSFEDAFHYVKAARGVANPNMGFACQLLQCQKRVHAVPASPNSVLRMYRIAPHSSYDSLHLVPKMIPDPDVNGLDSRGAFIVHVPSAIYVWIGKHCHSVMANSARTAALQVIKYERAQGSLLTVREGEEPDGFWAAFCGGEHLKENDKMFKAKEDIRKVDDYDQDFEIFHKALTGGVVPPFPIFRSGYGSETETCLPARETGWCRLRRKFAGGIMKEFLLSAKLVSGCDDFNLGFDKETEQSNPAAISPSSPPSPCGSPDSFSCHPDSSPKFSSKSPSLSPSTSDYCSSFSASSSNWSESTNPSCQPSPSGLSDQLHAKTLSIAELDSSEGMFSSNSHFKVSELSPCIAERRGSNPPSLTLPSVSVPSRLPKTMLRSCSFSLPDVDNEAIVENDPDSDDIVLDVNNLSLDKPIVYLWPNMEKLESNRCQAALEPKSVHFVFAPASCLNRSCNVLYIWLGNDTARDDNEGDCAQWEITGHKFLKDMRFPPSTTVQIIRQGEETDDFVDCLKQTIDSPSIANQSTE